MKLVGTSYVQSIVVTLSSHDPAYLGRVSEQAKTDLELLVKRGFLDYVNGYVVIHRDGKGVIRKIEKHVVENLLA